MAKKKSSCAAQRAWNLLRMALLWAGKGGALKRWPMLELRSLVPKYLKALAQGLLHGDRDGDGDRYLFRYGERELSFDKTPIFQVKMHRPASMRFLLPCITPQIDFDYDFEGCDDNDGGSYGYGDRYLDNGTGEYDNGVGEQEEEGIDVRAEEFITKFYEQIKLQRQISYLQYKESLDEEK